MLRLTFNPEYNLLILRLPLRGRNRPVMCPLWHSRQEFKALEGASGMCAYMQDDVHEF